MFTLLLKAKSKVKSVIGSETFNYFSMVTWLETLENNALKHKFYFILTLCTEIGNFNDTVVVLFPFKQ